MGTREKYRSPKRFGYVGSASDFERHSGGDGMGVKKGKFLKNTSKIEKGFKNWILNKCHMPPKKIFLKNSKF